MMNIMNKKKIFIFFLLILVLGFSPWLTTGKALSLIKKRIVFLDTPIVNKIPFGVIVKGDVGVCPICPAFSKKIFYVSPTFTIHNINNGF